MAVGSDLTGRGPPARIPKLKYRNPLPADQLAQLPVHSPSSDDQDAPASPPPTANSTYSRPSFDATSLTSSSLASTHSSAGSSNESKSSKKKTKAKSVLSFLSLKEPSQLALEQFAEAQKKQSSENPTSVPGSRPGSIYPAQKLPSHVPKVNSKWNGVPEVAKKRQSTATVSTASNKNRWSTSSKGSQGSQGSQVAVNPSRLSTFSVMSDATRNPPNSIASPRPSTSNLQNIDDNLSDGSSNANLPEMSYYFPEPVASGALEVPQTVTYQPAETVSPPLSPAADFVFDSPPPVNQATYHRAVSPASSTDSADTIVRDTADVIFKKLNDQPHQGLWADAPAVQPPLQREMVPESHDFLFGDDSLPGIIPGISKEDESPAPAPPKAEPVTPPVAHYVPSRPVQNFSRPIPSNQASPTRSPMSTSYRTTPMSSALPTLYEASLASTDEYVDDGEDDEEDDDDAQSIAPSTIAPSVLSEHWYESPRERLGLGGRLRMGDAQPWDSQRPSSGKKKSRLSMFGKVTART